MCAPSPSPAPTPRYACAFLLHNVPLGPAQAAHVSQLHMQGGAGFPFMGMGMRGVSWLQFNKEALEQQLPEQHGIQYKWMGKELGGLRKRDKSSEANAGGPLHASPCARQGHACSANGLIRPCGATMAAAPSRGASCHQVSEHCMTRMNMEKGPPANALKMLQG